MSEGEEKKRTGRQIGGIHSQYATLGGGRKPTERSDAQPSERPTIQPSSMPTIEASSHPSIQQSNMPDAQPSSHLDSKTSSMLTIQPSSHLDSQHAKYPEGQEEEKPRRIKMTLYLEEDNDDWIRDFCRRERRRLGHHVEISDVVNMALRSLRSQVES